MPSLCRCCGERPATYTDYCGGCDPEYAADLDYVLHVKACRALLDDMKGRAPSPLIAAAMDDIERYGPTRSHR